MTAAPRVLQVTAWYPPYRIGGTEVYLESLIFELRRLGVDSTVLAVRGDGMPERYDHAGTPVETYFVNEVPEASEFREAAPHRAFDAFQMQLAAHPGAIYHQHSWTRGCGPHHLRAARERGLRTVLTVHVASNLCMRGTMMQFGETACDGRVEEIRCGACLMQARGLPKAVAWPLAGLPLTVATAARRRGRGRLATGLAARALAAHKLRDVRDMIEHCDRIVAVCGWVRDALIANGAPRDKLVLSRQGLSGAYLNSTQSIAVGQPEAPQPLKLLYVGSFNPGKGIDVLVRAVRSLPPDVAVTLTIRGPVVGAEQQAYAAKVRALIGYDRRIGIEPAVPRDNLAAVMAGHDVLAVPSVLLETGPLVVLEAQAAGLFVLGSRLGGIAELIQDNGGGELIEAGNVAAWAAAIGRLAHGRRAARALPRCKRAVRSMSTVAAEMAELYRSL